MELRFNNIAPLTPKAIADAEDPSYKFNIPLYQRLFEWSEPQLKGLLIDLANHIRERKDSPYYIGMMTGNESTPIDLIDGQQRFTTIMLLGIQLREYYREWEKFVSMDRLAFSARPNDSQYLKSLIAPTENYNGPVNERFRKGCEIIRNFLDHDLKDFNVCKEEYAKQVFEILTFFVYKLPKCYKDNPQKLNKYFEAMNSAGRSLEQHEKLKVDLLARADLSSEDKSALNHIWNITEKIHKPVLYAKDENFPLSDNDNYIKILLCENKSLSEISKNLSSEADNGNPLTVEQIGMSSSVPDSRTIIDGTSAIIDFEELLLLALDITLKENRPYHKAKLEARFRELPNDKIPAFYRNLFVCRLILDRFMIRIEKDSQRNRYILKTDGEEVTDNINKQILQYQSMLYNGGGEMHAWLTPFVGWIMKYFQDESKAPSPKELFSEIRNIDNNIPSHRCPDPDVDILRYHETASIYYFQRLDYLLWERYTISDDNTFLKEYDNLVRNFSFSSNRSVEHFHPQNETHNEKWPEKHIDGEIELSKPIDTLGNLALISTSFNSEQSNDNENLKLARIKEQIDGNKLQSIKLLIMYDLAQKHNGHWSVDIAARHGREMMKILRDSYSKK